MNVAIVGTRGIPGNYGGFETFAEEISIRLNCNANRISVYCDNDSSKLKSFNGVNLEYSRYNKTNNPILFYLDSIFKASKKNDVMIVAGVGGSIFYFIPKFYGCKICTNIDGIESKRDKWSFFKKLYLKIAERFAILFSDIIIADSNGIKEYLLKKYGNIDKRIRVIEYGAYLNDESDNNLIHKYDLRFNDYYLVVSRLEPENNIKMIIRGYLNAPTDRPLIIVGNINNNDYVKNILSFASEKVRFLGGIYDKNELNSIRHGCFAYFHGHSVGGTNPSLLEALGAKNISICHDNVFNREVTNSLMFYFNNSSDVTKSIINCESLDQASREQLKEAAALKIKCYYNWESMAKKYFTLLSEF